MIVAGIYSFNHGREIIEEKYSTELKEVEEAITSVKESELKTKVSEEKNKSGKLLYSPRKLNAAFKEYFEQNGWKSQKIGSKSSSDHYINDYKSISTYKRGSREIDFVKKRVGVEIQFGKYSFMVYDVCGKMVIFHKLDHIDVGIEIVPIHDFQKEMSTGVSYFEQFVWDLEQRGVSNIDIPVLVLGIMADNPPDAE